METIRIVASVDEQDISYLTLGATAELTVDALPGQFFEASVTDISKFGSSSGGSSKFDVELEFLYAEGLLPGMNVSVVFPMEVSENCVTVPHSGNIHRGKVGRYAGMII